MSTAKEIEAAILALPPRERKRLIEDLPSILPELNGGGRDVSDEEVAQRERELDDGRVEPLSHKEFVRRVQKERRQ